MAIEKLVRVKVNTPKGERTLTFQKYGLDESDRRIPCTEKCPYSKSCELFPHPEFPDNETVEFSDYCGALGQDDDKALDLIPVEGTLEKNIGDLMTEDHLQKFISLDGLTRVSKVIDTVCPSWCDLYKPDHSGCTAKNKSCILLDLIKDRKVSSEITEEDSEKNE